MRIAILGLGRMGANMTTRLLRGGHEVIVYNRSEKPVRAAEAEGAVATRALEEVAANLPPPRTVWAMLPAGEVTEHFLTSMADFLTPGDLVIDGGNGYYKDAVRRAKVMHERGLRFLDVGVSGGIWGLTEGYSLMIGGEREDAEAIRPICETLAPAPDRGWGHVGPHGAGHFVKMVHNGIEYGMMQALAEGFALMRGKTEFALDTHEIAEIWRHGSVVRSWLLDLTAAALKENPDMAGIAPYVPDSGEGRWAVMEGIEQGCPLPVITMALEQRFRSQQNDPFAEKLLAVMRQQFGGHAVKSLPPSEEL